MEKLHVGVVVNPSKLKDVAEFRGRVVSHVFSVDPDAQVSFYETTVEDAGFGQAQQAVSDGCSVVLAAGGDGTVRLVAAGLAHSDVALGIVPMGTGNLFARNLGIPLDDLRGAIKVALTGEALTADLGYLQHGESLEDASGAKEEPFLVIAGFGFDAVVMENTNSKLKKAVGWLAYVVAGAKKIVGRGQSVDLELDGRSPKTLKARTVM
ncbi:MAG: diacylglycerol kinase family protein, partial [Dermabacter sp.]|nr:diacylglycerol kinase family protein [Dermabacter sp.]